MGGLFGVGMTMLGLNVLDTDGGRFVFGGGPDGIKNGGGVGEGNAAGGWSEDGIRNVPCGCVGIRSGGRGAEGIKPVRNFVVVARSSGCARLITSEGEDRMVLAPTKTSVKWTSEMDKFGTDGINASCVVAGISVAPFPSTAMTSR